MRLFVTDIRPLEDPDLFRRGLDRVLPERRAQAVRYLCAQDRCRSLGAGLLLEYALRTAGIEPATANIQRDSYGKPHCAAHPACHFNLSHAGHFAVCALGALPCGVDVERISGLDGVEAALHPDEVFWLHGFSPRERPFCFARLWTRKEAFLKATGRGLSLPPHSISVVPGCSPAWEGQHFFLREHALPGHILCLCLPQHAPFPEPEMHDMRTLCA